MANIGFYLKIPRYWPIAAPKITKYWIDWSQSNVVKFRCLATCVVKVKERGFSVIACLDLSTNFVIIFVDPGNLVLLRFYAADHISLQGKNI